MATKLAAHKPPLGVALQGEWPRNGCPDNVVGTQGFSLLPKVPCWIGEDLGGYSSPTNLGVPKGLPKAGNCSILDLESTHGFHMKINE